MSQPQSEPTSPRPRPAPAPAAKKPSPSTIPWIYRLPLLYIEPICALNGAYLLYLKPRSFLEAVSPHKHFPSAASSSSVVANASKILKAATSSSKSSSSAPPPLPNLASVRVLTDMLAGMNLLFAFNLAITLRAAGNDHKLWRVLCSGMLLSDAMHVYATVREFGWPAVLDYNSWRTIDWLNFGIMGCMTVVRVCVVAGLGLGKGGKTTTTAKKSIRSAKSTASLNSTTSAASTPPPVSEPPSEKSVASAAGSAPKKAKSTKTGKKTGGRAKKAESVTGKQ